MDTANNVTVGKKFLRFVIWINLHQKSQFVD